MSDKEQTDPNDAEPTREKEAKESDEAETLVMEDDDDEDDDEDDYEDMSDSEEEEEDEEDEEDEMSADDETGESVPTSKTRVYLPGLEKLKPGEILEHDPSAYVMLHRAEMGAPCLSFDVLEDELGDDRSSFPASCYIVCGTQSGTKKKEDKIMLLKMTNLAKTLKERKKKEKEDLDDESESESDESDDDEDEAEPVMHAATVNQQGACNRVRATKIGAKRFAASWSESGKVFVYDLGKPWNAVASESNLKEYNSQRLDARIKPVSSFKGHLTEGFALDWSRVSPGKLASGDCKGGIHVWTPRGDAADAWTVDQRPFVGHKDSVEDIQWSPTEATVFASGSVDKSLRIWDTRANPSSANMLSVPSAHDSDINVISWNRSEPFIASGGDDAVLKVWDLRRLQSSTPSPVAVFKHHSSAITSVEWHPTDASVFASSGADDQIVQWDLAVEKDDVSLNQSQDANQTDQPEGSTSAANQDGDPIHKMPPQLLFIHMGQKEIKEIHWHPQIPGLMLSTALDGLNVFKTISV